MYKSGLIGFFNGRCQISSSGGSPLANIKEKNTVRDITLYIKFKYMKILSYRANRRTDLPMGLGNIFVGN